MARRAALFAALGLGLAAAATGLAQAADPVALRGAQVYRTRCALCHGRAGDGHGAGAAGLDPKPSDFTRTDFWARATPEGLAAVVRQGRPGTAMPAFKDLSDADLQAVIQALAAFQPAAPAPTP